MNVETLEKRLQATLPRARLLATPLPQVPEIRLYLFDPEAMQGPLSHDEAQQVVAEPAYWSFCWASGQVLARFILDHADSVAGKHVLDVGPGSGVVAIAAAKAGAASVTACDIDPLALEAVQANAGLNGVEIRCVEALPEASVDLLTAADILYDRENLPLLETFRQRADVVWLADSRIRDLQADGYTWFATREAVTCPDLNEFEEFRHVRLYEARQK
ncbi:MAG: methyltransferase [Gammaproteobacteria bacterium]|nr:MAG: methyltransferase [Gammaproteobacteria bacterium]